MIERAQVAKSRLEHPVQHTTTRLMAIERSLACSPIAGSVPSLLSSPVALQASAAVTINSTSRASTSAIVNGAVSAPGSKPPAYSWQDTQVASKSKREPPKHNAKEVSTKQPLRKWSPKGSLIDLLRPDRHSKEGRSESSSRVCADRTHNNKPNQSPPPNAFANANQAVPTIGGNGSSERPTFPTNIQASTNLVAAVPGAAQQGNDAFESASNGALDAMEQLRAINQTFHYHQSRFTLPAKLDFIAHYSLFPFIHFFQQSSPSLLRTDLDLPLGRA
ncbi:hypothetical protein DFP72DRAFT_1073073 [Ephemerocybe angulata]|uniref:Uncharacterized protein n=1 Tax=Ephemerocybe angulata TaxID=980116 RepID=A0A8H6LZ77_9AGAR|nr:hypothetical protein DFP72DRAFT_1073073 [Tulosesus angulatus]